MEHVFESRHYTIWQLLKLYWQSEERKSAYLFFAGAMLLTVTLVGFSVIFNFWYNEFYDALQAYNKTRTIRLLFFFFGIAALYIVVAVYRYYVSQVFAWRWRRWLTEHIVERWFQHRSYYLLEHFDKRTDNPDQRIQEDAGAIVTSSINLSIGIVESVTTLIGFIYILWRLSGVLTLPLGPLGTYHVYGYLVWVSLLYAGAGTFFTFKLGRPLVGLNFEQQRREATFRYAAIDVRTHSENVALYRGEEHQQVIIDGLFKRVLTNWMAIIKRQKLLLWFTAGYNQTAVVLPLLVALPNYFSKVFLLGGLMQSLQAFGRVQDSMSFLVNSFTSIAEWRAISRRLTTFLDHLADVEEQAKKENKLVFTYHESKNMVMRDVTISTPRHQVLLRHVNETLEHGRRYLIKGESGIGKSTLVRVIAGIWPYAEGQITMPSQAHMMYLPQKSYMPIGTLAEAILFPDKKYSVLESQLPEVLRACHLEEFIPRLHEHGTWSDQLSPGELQRVAFARLLLQKPDWAFLDESTSMLDTANETYLYQLLRDRLPGCSIVSVGHRPTLDEFHDHIIDVTRYSV
jgi:putative ATP-binding cassette transporter